MPFIIIFSCLIALAGTSSTVLNSNGASGHPCLFPDLRERTLCFTIEYDVSCGFFIYGLHRVGEISFYL